MIASRFDIGMRDGSWVGRLPSLAPDAAVVGAPRDDSQDDDDEEDDEDDEEDDGVGGATVVHESNTHVVLSKREGCAAQPSSSSPSSFNPDKAIRSRRLEGGEMLPTTDEGGVS